ncbi:MAG: ATP-binding cassette domain-containing protein [Lachnospiraceae bacterium]|nr:ATP-binding cassette domain-containing protein [Lachnospiraceae bacterium]
MIRAEHLVKTFTKIEKKQQKTEFNAVNDISLEIKEGEILGILGPNGAGKTTLLRMLGKLMEPTSGRVYITDREGQAITDNIEIKKRIGYLSGNTKLYNRLSARELLTMLGDIYELEAEAVQKRIEEIAEVMDMTEFVDNRIEHLSTGQTQRVSIARCLLHSPDTYIFDEPTLGLDILSSRSIVEFMKKERAAGKSVLYSTHYMEEAEFLCDRIIMVHKGQIIAEGTPEELRTQTGTSNLRDTFLSLIEHQEGDASHEDK